MTHDQVFIAFIDFIYQRPNLDYEMYRPYREGYNTDKARIDNSLRNAKRQLDIFSMHKAYDHNLMVQCLRSTWRGRLEFVNGELDYTPGQYFATEYRECAYQVLKLYNERAA